MDYNLSISKIAKKNRVTPRTVRLEVEEATSTMPDYQKNLLRVISFDEFKADTKELLKITKNYLQKVKKSSIKSKHKFLLVFFI